MSDKKTVEVKRIVIRIGDKEVSLLPDEARELKDILKAMFGDQAQIITVPTPYPVYPWYDYTPPYQKWEITWCVTGVNSNTVYCSSNT